MADTLESLEIEVVHKSQGAGTAIGAITRSITALGKSLDNALPKFKEFADSLGKIGVAFTYNDQRGSTFNKTVQNIKQSTKGAAEAAKPLSEGMQMLISGATKYATLLEKEKQATQRMQDAFDRGDEEAAWKAREQAISAATQAEKEYQRIHANDSTPLSKRDQDIISSASKADIARAKIAALKDEMQSAFATGDANKAFSLRGQILQLEESLNKTSDSAKKFQRAIQSGIVKAIKNATQTVSRFVSGALRQLRNGIKSLTSNVKASIAPLTTLFSSLKRIAFYRLIRSAIKAITQAFQEGAENAYWYSREFGIASKYISEAYDALATSSFQMKNQLGAAWATLIAAIEPVVEQIISLVQRAAEVVTQFFAILGGKSTYLKAVKVARQWADATEDGSKAAKEWRNQLLGFDEINRLDAPTDSGSGSNKDNTPDYGTMFEEAPIQNYMKDLMDAIRNGEWANIGAMLADKLNGLVDSVDWEGWGKKIGEKINNVIQLIYSFLKNVDFKQIGQSLGEALKGMMDSIDFETLGRLFVRKFTAMLDFIIGLVMTPGFWESLAKAVGDFFHGALQEAAEWLSENNLADVIARVGQGILGVLQRVCEEIKEHKDVFVQIGKQIGDSLAAIPWLEILKTIADILWTVFKSLVIDGLFSTTGGKIFLGLLAAVKGLKLVFTLASPVVEAGITILAKTIAEKLLGIPAAVTATATATQTAVGGIGTAMAAGAAVVAKGAMAVVDAVLVAYDVKSLNEAARTYHEAQDAHAKEAYTALNNYAKLYHEKGKEVADAWAKMVYDVDTTGEDFFGAQKALTNKIDDLWADTPQNMAQGFGQGVKYYFGGGGGGIIGLLNDAGNGIINAFKKVLGINSPSTVFAEIGKNIVQGLKNGFSNAWNSFASAVKSSVSSIVQTITTSISSAVQNAWSKIESMVSKAKSTLSNIVSTVSSKVSSVVSSVKSSVRLYASGGYPTEGQLFVARESGPELVGSISGRTAVATNDDILEGIRQGVYEAVSAAMGSGYGSQDIRVYLDGREIRASQRRLDRVLG